MSRHYSKKSLTALALTVALGASSAQACVFGLPFLAPAAACPTQAETGPACPVQPSERDPDCLLHKRDLAQAAGAMGNMAAGGMNLAGGLFRGLVEQAQRAGRIFGGL